MLLLVHFCCYWCFLMLLLVLFDVVVDAVDVVIDAFDVVIGAFDVVIGAF